MYEIDPTTPDSLPEVKDIALGDNRTLRVARVGTWVVLLTGYGLGDAFRKHATTEVFRIPLGIARKVAWAIIGLVGEEK